ncbi:MAG: hypothetical protein IPK23_05730 [Rhizobiales bacterium]|nr:hypothetical protein [Hyphomicrobiales bacterium]
MTRTKTACARWSANCMANATRSSIMPARLRDSISNAHEAFSFDVQNIADRVSSALDNATGRITDNIMLRAEDARALLVESGNTIIGTLTEKSDDATTRLLESGNTIIGTLAEKSNDATTRLLESGKTVVESLSDRSAEATQRLTEVGVQIAKAIADRNDKVSEALQQSTDQMHTKLAERAAGISEMIAASGQTFENTIGQQLQSLADNVAVKGNEIANRISADTGSLSQAMTESVQTFDTTVRAYGGNVVNEMKAAVAGVTEASRDSLALLDERVAAKASEVNEEIEKRIAQIEVTLDDRSRSLNEMLAVRTNDFSTTITEGSKAATEAVDRSVTGMGEYFAARTAEMAATLSERASKIDETLGNRAMQITETLDTRVNKFEELIVNRLENVTSTIEQKSIASTDLLVERVNSVNDHIRSTAEHVEKRIGDTSMQVERNLTTLADGITKNFIERVNNITGAHETLRAEVRDIIAELGQTHSLLQASIDTASSILGPIEGKIADRITAFHQTLDNAINATRSTADRMDHQIRELNDSSNGVLRDVSSLAIRFEEQVRLVAATSDSLNQTHKRIDDGLTSRRDTIEQITTTLSDRTGELEERLTRFNKMLEETFSHAQDKAQDVARMVAESTATATQSIARQYELIRNSSGEERERTNIALKDTYDEAMQSVNAMFSEANARFLEASRDLREISEDIQRTLDTTREEVRRTVFELPTETKESANAMRRVVADQIKALSELNDIVARHGRHAEAPTAYDYREEEMAAVGGRAPRNALPRPHYDDGGDLPPAPPARMREEAPEPRRPERKPADRSARFDEALSKKMRAAEPEPDDAAGGIDSLDSLSIDIARMIDHEAAAEAWERFKRGERGVFNRRLYTNAGQKSFEEIRKKYRRNAEFRETVDRYIDEFEKLLEQVSRDERGQTLTRTYLTSDTGKVYTLLAHAAGRLG